MGIIQPTMKSVTASETITMLNLYTRRELQYSTVQYSTVQSAAMLTWLRSLPEVVTTRMRRKFVMMIRPEIRILKLLSPFQNVVVVLLNVSMTKEVFVGN